MQHIQSVSVSLQHDLIFLGPVLSFKATSKRDPGTRVSCYDDEVTTVHVRFITKR